MIRETVYSTLFNLLQTNLGTAIVTYSRRLALWNEIPTSAQPALYLVEKGETVSQDRRGIPPKFELDCEVWLYANGGESSSVVPSGIINPIVDSIVTALTPAKGTDNTQTLGLSYVTHCWISGHIEIFEGVLGSQIIAIIPIKILGT